MTATWSTEKISSLLYETFTSSDTPKPGIDVLITFDSRGISSHPNHISLYHGARAFVSSLTQGRPDSVDLYTLTTVNFFRKYLAIFDICATLGLRRFIPWGDEARLGEKKTDSMGPPTDLVFVHGLGKGGWATAREAMTDAHVSQMKWFRYGWITLSRYMLMNDLKLEKV